MGAEVVGVRLALLPLINSMGGNSFCDSTDENHDQCGTLLLEAQPRRIGSFHHSRAVKRILHPSLCLWVLRRRALVQQPP